MSIFIIMDQQVQDSWEDLSTEKSCSTLSKKGNLYIQSGKMKHLYLMSTDEQQYRQTILKVT